MLNDTRQFIAEYCKYLDPETLETVKKIIVDRIERDCPGDFMFHDFIDDYIYIVTYKDGHTSIDCKGSVAYHRYISEDGIKIERKTKDLFPTFETLVERS